MRGPARLLVFRKGERVELQRLRFDQIWVQLDGDQTPLVNSARLYEFQGTINVADFNFDGKDDIAVQIDQSGPYGGPTYDVFLASPDGRFVRSEPLSHLTRGTLGLFQVDAKRHRLVTLAKSGCCYHVTEELEIVADQPVPVFRVTGEVMDVELIVTEERLICGKWRKTTRRRPLPPEVSLRTPGHE